MNTIKSKSDRNIETLIKELSDVSEIFFNKKVFFDLEFTGLKRNADIISAGFISESDEELYIEFNDYDVSKCDNWVWEHVIAKLTEKKKYNRKQALQKILDYFEGIRKPEEQILLISDCLSYDWMLLNELWGGALKIPKYLYYIPIDLSTMFYVKGVDPDVNREVFAGVEGKYQKHNSLWDAKIIKLCFEKLIKRESNDLL